MKNHISKALIILSILGTTSRAHAWIYELANHTNHTIAVGMRYKGKNEPLEFRVIEPHTMGSFKPGDPGISAWKKAFVVDMFYYLKNPPTITETAKSSVPWENAFITWLSPEMHEEAMALSEAPARNGKLATLLESANKITIEPTMAQNRHIDIIEDSDGKINFISVLSKEINA
ncbi:MAG TPA: hypothetical protein VJ201_01020 [Candidatus Babeliales bacterium]|nr:hypothetical protein [Candidatus Babeliales bacterium]HLC06926.1 hypothetical protein [Candidatus Babeliales bacterium]